MTKLQPARGKSVAQKVFGPLNHYPSDEVRGWRVPSARCHSRLASVLQPRRLRGTVRLWSFASRLFKLYERGTIRRALRNRYTGHSAPTCALIESEQRHRKAPYGTGPIRDRAERINGPTDHTSAILPSLTKGQRLKVPVDGGLVFAEVIEVTKLTTDVPVKWKLLARELATPQERSIPIDQLNASNDD
jgi:hypothetical protein